jgi:hypothetical protein
MQEYQLDIELRQIGKYDNNDYRLFINDELMLERPWTLPDGYEYQVVHLTCKLAKGGNSINLQNIHGNLVLGKININNKEIVHTNGYFEL